MNQRSKGSKAKKATPDLKIRQRVLGVANMMNVLLFEVQQRFQHLRTEQEILEEVMVRKIRPPLDRWLTQTQVLQELITRRYCERVINVSRLRDHLFRSKSEAEAAFLKLCEVWENTVDFDISPIKGRKQAFLVSFWWSLGKPSLFR